MPAKEQRSLAEFSKAFAFGCKVCLCEQREEIDEGLRSGTTPHLIYKWLVQSGVGNVSASNLKHHFYSNHHKP